MANNITDLLLLSSSLSLSSTSSSSLTTTNTNTNNMTSEGSFYSLKSIAFKLFQLQTSQHGHDHGQYEQQQQQQQQQQIQQDYNASFASQHHETLCNEVTTCYGVPYNEFTCTYPSIRRYYSSIELFYDPTPMLYWMRDHPMIPLGVCIFYCTLIVLGQQYYHNKPAWKCRTALAGWNLFLCVFSMIGFLRTFPHLLHNILTLSVRDNMCLPPTYGCGSTGIWILLFVLSKFPELIDTYFLVIHKKSVIFLHWYHHVTVLLYCWHSYVTLSPTGIFFSVMNYAVHASMYGYYFMMAIQWKPRWFNPLIITTFQISQMFFGVAVTLVGFYYYKTDPTCEIQPENNTAAFLMYGSYLLLFLQFFIGRYIEPRVTFISKSVPVSSSSSSKTTTTRIGTSKMNSIPPKEHPHKSTNPVTTASTSASSSSILILPKHKTL